ncbi:MAG: hypothetical protein H6914_02365 [Novosphingobium sp.]|nr:hypothetical protein [Novosphingobium sp.]
MSRRAAPAIAIAALLAAAQAHAQIGPDSLQDFQLPPDRSPQPDVQGPVTANTPPPRANTSAAPPPAAVEAPPAAVEPAAPVAPTRTAAPPPRSPATAAAARPESATPAPAVPPAASAPAAPPRAAEAAPQAPATVVPDAPVPALAPPPAEGMRWWEYALAGLLLVPMAFAGWLFWRQRPRDRAGSPVAVGLIERPRPRPVVREEPNGPGQAAEPLEAAEVEIGNSQLRYALETSNLSLTLVNATLTYRLTLTNVSRRSIHDLTVDGDMISAHASLPQEQQLAGAQQQLPRLHDIKALLPGQSLILNGKLRLPISAIHPIRRDQAVLFVPLARLRMNGTGMDEVVLETTLVGQRPAGPGAGLRPFRLDLGPRIYTDLGQRPLNAAA